MDRTLPIAAVVFTACVFAVSPVGAQVFASLELAQTDVPTFDPVAFEAGPDVDVWRLVVSNGRAEDITSIELSLPGPWLNALEPTLTFSDQTGLPTLGPHFVAESFLVLPPGANRLAVGTTDDNTLLASSYTLVGDIALVEAGDSAVVAVLSTLAGQVTEVDVPTITGAFTGSFAADGEVEFFSPRLVPHCDLDDPTCPEPAGLLLAVATLTTLTTRRPCRPKHSE